MVMGQISDRELHEECGVFGVFGVKDAASLTYYGLHALQHRGQEGAGIVTVDRDATFRRIKGGGLVTEVFGEGNLSTLKGDMAIGHVRYTTAGGGGIENVQPFLFRHNTGDFALAHNGNIVNSALLRIYLENKGSLFQSTSDSEILAHLIKKETKYHDRPRIYSTCWVRSSSATSSRARSSRSTARASGAAISRSISVARCARWSISTLHVPTVTSKGATSMPTARSRGACSSARRLPRRTAV